MEARRFSRLLLPAIALAVCGHVGCSELQNPGAAPDSRRDPTAAPAEPAIIVKDTERAMDKQESGSSPDSFGDVILDYIKRIDAAEANKKQPAAAMAPSNPPAEKSQMIFDPTNAPVEASSDKPSQLAKPAMGNGETAQSSASPVPASEEPEDRSAQFTQSSSVPTAADKKPAAASTANAPAKDARPAVTIRPVPHIERPTSPPVADEETSVNGAATARNVPQSLRDFVALTSSPGEDAPFSEQLDYRMLMALAGDVERAREPLPMASHEQAEIAARYIESLIAIRDGHLGDPTEAATTALREIDKLADALRQVSRLSVPVIEICREARAFGQYSPISPREFRTGSPIEFVLYCEVRDFTTRQIDGGQLEARFELTTTIFDNVGGEVLRFEDRDLVDRCRTRRRDCFIPRLIRLPATFAPGTYVAKITLVDKLGDKVVETKTDFRITAR